MSARTLLPLLLLASVCCPAQNPLKAFPQNYKLALDSPDFAVLRVHYGPHEKVGMHDHSAFSTIYVYLNDSGPVRFQHTEEAHPFDLVRPPTHAGAFRVSPGRIERHSVENLSDLPSDYLRIELKKLRRHHPQRIPRPGTIAAARSRHSCRLRRPATPHRSHHLPRVR